MRQSLFTSPLKGSVKYPNNVAFMYSRQPVIVECSTAGALPVTVTVTCTSNNNLSHIETRYLNNGYAEFDISRIMQMLAPGPDQALNSLTYAAGVEGRSAVEVYSLSVTLDGATILSLTSDIQGMYGMLDPTEVYGGKVTRRVFVNYPQSINLWYNALGNHEVNFNSYTQIQVGILDPSIVGRCREVTIEHMMHPMAWDLLRSGQALKGTISWLYRIQEGEQTQQASRQMTLIPDTRERGSGVYLRWLSRTGEAAYWLFDRVEIETAAAVAETFKRHYTGDPAAPAGRVIRNSDKRGYDEQRRMALKAGRVSEEEFDMLTEILSSPVVDMLMETPEYHSLGLIFNGGPAGGGFDAEVTADANGASTVDGGTAVLTELDYESNLKWVRINVDGGSQSRSNRRDAPRLHDFELSISLMPRNTIRL